MPVGFVLYKNAVIGKNTGTSRFNQIDILPII